MVFGTVLEWAVRIRFRGMDIPIGNRGCSWSLELHRLPYYHEISSYPRASDGYVPPGCLAGVLKIDDDVPFSSSGVDGTSVERLRNSCTSRNESHARRHIDAAPYSTSFGLEEVFCTIKDDLACSMVFLAHSPHLCICSLFILCVLKEEGRRKR